MLDAWNSRKFDGVKFTFESMILLEKSRTVVTEVDTRVTAAVAPRGLLETVAKYAGVYVPYNHD